MMDLDFPDPFYCHFCALWSLAANCDAHIASIAHIEAKKLSEEQAKREHDEALQHSYSRLKV